jgi:exodeoxyribonuclease VII small subunit
MSYESASKELERILSTLQNGEASLDELPKMIEKANKLVKDCKEKLRSVEKALGDFEAEV